MRDDDYYDYDPYWDDTEPDHAEDCTLCGKTPQRCVCDEEDLSLTDYL